MLPTDFSKGQAWLIKPESFETLARKFHEWNFADISPDMDIEKQMQNFKNKTFSKDFYDLVNGIAVIPVSGPLTKKMSFFSFLFGGSTYGMISKAFNEAIMDNDVEGIVLNIDSPGGTVTGTEALGELIFDSRKKKPIVAFANGMMASSAYWIGSGADAIVGESTADIGSIGVLMIHRDYSEFDKKKGVKISYLTAGRYKALGNDAEPLSEEAKQIFQAELDYIYSIFIETVARNRDRETEHVISNMADGKMFIGQQAVDIGLIDQVGNLEMAIELAKVSSDNSTYHLRRSEKMSEKDKSLKIETTEQLATAYPDLVIQIHNEAEEKGIKSIDIEKIEKDAKQKESERIMGLVVAQFGEEEGEKFKAIVESGVTVDQFKAIQATTQKTDDKDLKKKMLDAIEKAGAENPGADASTGTGTEKDFMTLVQEYKAQNGCGVTVAMKAIAKSHPKVHEAYLKSVNPRMQ